MLTWGPCLSPFSLIFEAQVLREKTFVQKDIEIKKSQK
jgi:hypothetical protein